MGSKSSPTTQRCAALPARWGAGQAHPLEAHAAAAIMQPHCRSGCLIRLSMAARRHAATCSQGTRRQ